MQKIFANLAKKSYPCSLKKNINYEKCLYHIIDHCRYGVHTIETAARLKPKETSRYIPAASR